jgi:hypothetical protein
MKNRKFKGKPGKEFGRNAMRTHKFNLNQAPIMRGGIRL